MVVLSAVQMIHVTTEVMDITTVSGTDANLDAQLTILRMANCLKYIVATASTADLGIAILCQSCSSTVDWTLLQTSVHTCSVALLISIFCVFALCL
jgi:hypothetical protein